jgi:hypothetical protein
MKKKSVPILIPFLILVSMLFIGILIFAYVETKKANPQMIEQSRDRGTHLGSGALRQLRLS